MVRVQKQREEEPSTLAQEPTTICGETIQTSLGVLQSASDFQIHGGNISSIGGDCTSFTANGDVHVVINHHHPSSPTPSVSAASASSSSHSISVAETDSFRDQRREDIFSLHDIGRRSSLEATMQPTLPIQANCDIYRSHLATMGRGLPLWIPEPSQNLPIEYQRKGISMGDVGVVTSSGGFLYLFNILHTHDHPFNPPVMPEGFKPLKLKQAFYTVSSQRALKDNSYLARPSNIRARRDRGTSSLIFESSECDGAILTTPVGAKSEDLPCLAGLRKYVTTNLTSWYRYARLYLELEIDNGDLRVVTGCDKTSAWGMACLGSGSGVRSTRKSPDSSSAGPVEECRFYLEFGPTDNRRGQGGRYEWAYSGEVAEARAGPDASEVAPLRLGASGHGEEESLEEDTEYYENQCLFLRTMNPALSAEAWQQIMLEEEQGSDSEADEADGDEEQRDEGMDADEEKADVDRRSGHRTSKNSKAAYQRNFSIGPPVSTTNIVPLNVSCMPPHFPSMFMSWADHPSITLNKYLSQIRSADTTMVMSLDQDWMSVLREDDVTLPPSEELLKRILENHSICEEEGVIFFDSVHQHTVDNATVTTDAHFQTPQTQPQSHHFFMDCPYPSPPLFVSPASIFQHSPAQHAVAVPIYQYPRRDPQDQQQQQQTQHHDRQSSSSHIITPTQPAVAIRYTEDTMTKLTDSVRRRCFNCCTTDTSTWRRSSLIPGKVLCNKCGLFERTHSRSRPNQLQHHPVSDIARCRNTSPGINRRAMSLDSELLRIRHSFQNPGTGTPPVSTYPWMSEHGEGKSDVDGDIQPLLWLMPVVDNDNGAALVSRDSSPDRLDGDFFEGSWDWDVGSGGHPSAFPYDVS